MKKNKYIAIIVFVVLLFFVGIFSMTISTGSFFFTTKYFYSPLKAYNDLATHDIIIGDTHAEKEIGFISLDSHTGLFLGEINENYYVIQEMQIKNQKYVSKGICIYFDLRESSDGTNRYATETENGSVEWAVEYSQEEVNQLKDVTSVEEFDIGNNQKFFVVIFKK